VVREHFISRFSERELREMAEMWDRVAPCNGGLSEALPTSARG
jgi:hypothetical protein